MKTKIETTLQVLSIVAVIAVSLYSVTSKASTAFMSRQVLSGKTSNVYSLAQLNKLINSNKVVCYLKRI